MRMEDDQNSFQHQNAHKKKCGGEIGDIKEHEMNLVWFDPAWHLVFF